MEYEVYCEELLRLLVTQGADDFKENVRIAGVIEDKAQKVAGLAGIFLAAGLAFINKENFNADSVVGGIGALLFLGLAIVLLVLTVLQCLRVIWVSDHATPISLDLMVEIAQDTFNQPQNSINFKTQQANRWHLVHTWKHKTDQQIESNKVNARHLKSAQMLLAGSILAVSAALLLIMIRILVLRVIQFWNH